MLLAKASASQVQLIRNYVTQDDEWTFKYMQVEFDNSQCRSQNGASRFVRIANPTNLSCIAAMIEPIL